MTLEDPASQSSRSRWSGTHLAKAGVAYAVLAALGVGILLEFVPSIFDLSELSWLRLVVLLVLLVFVGAPAVAAGYFILNVVVEGLVMGVGWVFQVCFRAAIRSLRRIFHGSGE